MNHLRELMDTLNAGRWLVDEALSDTAATRCEAHFRTFAQHAVCFDIGDAYALIDLKIVPQLVKLPYPICWFEGTAPLLSNPRQQRTIGALCFEIGNGSKIGRAIPSGPANNLRFGAIVWTRDTAASQWYMNGAWFLKELLPGEQQFAERGNPLSGKLGDYSILTMPSTSQTVLVTLAYPVQAFLSALHCSNVARREELPNPKLQKARARRGKAPLFSTWTLELSFNDSSRSGIASSGGTHASPRLHLRRGHPREYAPEKWTWVQPHVVGNKSMGMVHKDYALETPDRP